MTAPSIHLLALSGLSPAVISETIFALCVRPPAEDIEPVKLKGLKIITTTAGRERLLKELSPALEAMARDWPEAARRFPGALHARHILVPALRGQGELHDVSSLEESACMGAAILRAVRDWTRPDLPPLHASLAGGRKAMGTYMSQAMTLHARPQDRLSHVLVSAQAERPGFFYPAPGDDPTTSPEQINLYEIPFIRLRGTLGAESRGASSEALIRALQERVAPPRLVIDGESRSIALNGTLITLTPLQGSLFILFAAAAQTAHPVRLNQLRLQHSPLNEAWRRIIHAFYGRDPDTLDASTAPRTSSSQPTRRADQALRRHLTTLNQALANSLAGIFLPQLQIHNHRRRSGLYSMSLPPDGVVFQNADALQIEHIHDALTPGSAGQGGA